MPHRILATSLVMLFGVVLALGSGGGSSDPAPSTTTTPPTPPPPTNQPSARTLAITPIAQQTQVWCWAATAEMIFRFYSMPNLNQFGNYQCGVVAAFYGVILPQVPACFYDCSVCAGLTVGTLDREKLLIDQYGIAARSFGVNSRVLTSNMAFSALSRDDVAAEIAAGRPVLAGISPNGFPLPGVSDHAVVIVGYDYSGAVPVLIINDPFPYEQALQVSPYVLAGGIIVQPGRYRISYDAFVGALRWANTLYKIE